MFVHFNPLLTAQSCYRDSSQTLDPKVRLAIGYPMGAFEVQAAIPAATGFRRAALPIMPVRNGV